MTILAQIELPGVTKEQYDAMHARIASGQVPATGCLSHAAVVTDAGVRVIDLWESPEAMETFNGLLMPAVKDLGMPTPTVPPTVTEVYSYWVPGSE